MTVSEANIVKRWKLISSKDLGTSINNQSSAFYELFCEVFEKGHTQVKSNQYINRIIRAFAINEMIQDECSIVECLDLNYINITNYAAQQLDNYLMNNLGWLERFDYALSTE